MTLRSCSMIFAMAAAAVAQTPGTNNPKFVEMFQPMRDTVVLAANVYLPEGPGPFPTILLRTPYIKDNPREPVAAKKYVDAGYAYVDQDTRGKGHSNGVYKAFTTDIEDGYDTIEWISQQPWSNGKVGIMGTSALGITSNMAAMSGAPHLVAAYVSLAPYEMMKNSYPGGVLKDADTVGWTRRQGASEAALAAISGNALDSEEYARNSVHHEREIYSHSHLAQRGMVRHFRRRQPLFHLPAKSRSDRCAGQPEADRRRRGPWRIAGRHRISAAKRPPRAQ